MNRSYRNVLKSSRLFIVMLVLGLSACSSNGEHTAQTNQSAHADHGGTPHSSASPASAAPTPRIPAHFTSAAEAKPLPAVMDPKNFSDPVVIKAYEYAAQNPALFAQQPCYCYCDTGYGHRSLLDCYAGDHSVSCALCLKEGLLVHKLHQEGKSASEIRDLIVRGDWQNVKLE